MFPELLLSFSDCDGEESTTACLLHIVRIHRKLSKDHVSYFDEPHDACDVCAKHQAEIVNCHTASALLCRKDVMFKTFAVNAFSNVTQI